MSGTVATDPGSPATQSTAAASGGVAGAGVVIICWVLSLVHITVPAEVAASAMVCLAPVIHVLALYMGAGELTVVAPPAAAHAAPPSVTPTQGATP